MLPFFISLGIFFIFGCFISAFILNGRSKRQQRLIAVVQGQTGLNINKKTNLNTQDQRRTDLAKKLKEAGNGKPKNGTSISEKIMQAGLQISVKQFWIFSVVSCIILTGVMKLFGFADFVVLMSAIIGFFGLPRFYLKMKANKRQKEFMIDFPDALESMMRLLKAGMPVSEAIKMVAKEFTGPIGEEMSRVYDQQKIGVPLPEAVLESARRIPLTEVQMFATAIAIQTQTGSSLSEVLQNLSTVIRSRFQLKRKIKALSSEAKASAMIIGALPLFVMGGLYLVNREYIMILFEEPTGNTLLMAAAFWMAIGVLIMRQMINFRV